MKKPAEDIGAVEEWARGNLRSDAATALREDRAWTYPPPRRLLRSGAVTFPYPRTITDAAEAERWAAAAEDLAAGIKDFAALLLVVAGAMLSMAFTLGLGVELSILIAGTRSVGAEIASWISLGVTAGATIAFVAGFLPVPRATVWERRAAALRARAVDLSSVPAAAGETSGQCQRWHWPCPRGHHG